MQSSPIRPAPTPGNLSGVGASQPPAQPGQPSDRYKAYLKVKVGVLEFSSIKGEILGNPYIRLSTYQFSGARIIVNDPDDLIRPKIEQQEAVEIEIGYVGGVRQNVLMGKVYYVGRVLPGGTEIEVIDNAAPLQQTGASIQNAKAAPDLSLVQLNKQPKGQQLAAPTIVNPLQSLVQNPLAQGAIGLLPGFGELTQLLQQTVQTATGGNPTFSPASQFVAQDQQLRFSNASTTGLNAAGSVRLSQGSIHSAMQTALLQGDVVVARGNTIEQVSPGAASSSGVILDFRQNPSLAITNPRIIKKSPLQLQSAFGSISVQGWNPADKTTVGATVVTPGPAPIHPTGIINVPEWGQIKLNDPIYPGSLYTWADATKNGTRIPESNSIMQAIARIARVMDDLSRRYANNNAFQINSWYRDPASNRRVGGAPKSEHMRGHAVDFYHPNMAQIYADLANSWNGGVAIAPGAFVHIDLGPRARWRY